MSRGSRGKPKRGGRRGRALPHSRSSTTKKTFNTSNEYAELMDLNQGTYVPEVCGATTSMKSASKRPRNLFDEAKYTDSHSFQTIRKPLRHMPIVFVKAKEVYNPSADLFKNMKNLANKEAYRKNQLEVADDDLEGVIEAQVQDQEIHDLKSVDIIEDTDEIIETVSVNSVIAFPTYVEETSAFLSHKNDHAQVRNIPEIDDHGRLIQPKTIIADNEATSHMDISSDDDTAGLEFFVDETGDDDLLGSKNVSQPKPLTASLIEQGRSYANVVQSSDIEGSCIEYDPILTIGKVSLQTKIINDSVETELMSVPQLNKVAKPGFVNESIADMENLKLNDRFDPADSDIDEDSDTELAYKDYISQIMGDRLTIGNDEDESEDGSYDTGDSDDDDETKDAGDYNYSDGIDDESDEDIKPEELDTSNSTKLKKNKSAGNSERKPKDPEYGFLPEDYNFDVSTMKVSQIRQGISNSYNVVSFQLTGLEDEPVWIPEGDLIDFVTENGVPESRITAFLRYISQDLLDEDDPEPQPDYSDVHISETSDEEEVELADESDEDDRMKRLLAFSNSQKSFFANLDIKPTQTLKTKGKGKKKRLDLSSVNDMEVRESLQEQYLTHKKSRKIKKRERRDENLKNAVLINDLLIKYPFSMHIKDIRDEFEGFLHSESMAINFPPMDPHGLRTIVNMAGFYGMKSRKLGKGSETHVAVIKTKKTFGSLPDYDSIGRILRQRPIFQRNDVKKTTGEIINSGGNKRGPKSQGELREGDIVGSQAPEIGRDNVGRRLLERLGWSKGMGLGAEGNEGINEPVIAKIKKTKEGLK